MDPLPILVVAFVVVALVLIVQKRQARREADRARYHADEERSVRESRAQAAFVPTIPRPAVKPIRPTPAEVRSIQSVYESRRA